MNTKNVLIGGFAGGVAFFLLGWLIYGMLLMNYMMSISPYIPGLYRDESEMLLGIMFLSNLLSGLLMAFIFDIGKVSGWMDGLKTGAIVGFLISASFNSSLYAMTFMSSKRSMLVDVIASTVMWAIAGALIAMAMGMGSKKTS